MIDPHSLPFACLLCKAAPNLLLSLGGSAQSPFLQLGKDDLRAVRVSLMSMLPDRPAKLRNIVAKPRNRAVAFKP